MRQDAPGRLVRLAPLLLAAAAFVALFLPYAMQAWSPPGAPGAAHAEMQARVDVGRVLASLFAAAAVTTLALRFHIDPEGATRQAVFLGLAGFVVAGAALLPIYDGLESEAVHYRYTRSGTLAAEEGVQMEGVHGGLDGVIYKAYALKPASADEPLRLGPVPMTRGDGWLVHVYALAADAGSPIVSAPGVDCRPDAFMDGRGARASYVGAVYQCTAQRSGTTVLTVHDGGGEARNHEVTLYSLPVLHNAYLQRLDDTVAFHAAGLGLSAFTLLYWVRRVKPHMSISW